MLGGSGIGNIAEGFETNCTYEQLLIVYVSAVEFHVRFMYILYSIFSLGVQRSVRTSIGGIYGREIPGYWERVDNSGAVAEAYGKYLGALDAKAYYTAAWHYHDYLLTPNSYTEGIDFFVNGMSVAMMTGPGGIKSPGRGILGAKSVGGESEAAAFGRRAHSNYGTALGEAYDTKVSLPSGKKPDAVDWMNREVRELKPDNQRAIRRGERQVEKYRTELEQVTGQSWTSAIDTYRK